jgi:hypothetical protein
LDRRGGSLALRLDSWMVSMVKEKSARGFGDMEVEGQKKGKFG